MQDEHPDFCPGYLVFRYPSEKPNEFRYAYQEALPLLLAYTALCKFAHMARATVATAITKLEGLGLIARIKRRVRLSWHQGGQASRQATSCYRLCPPTPDAAAAGAAHTEFGGRTVNQGMEVCYQERTAGDGVEAAQEALAAVRERRRPLLDTLLGRERAKL